jgi:hypothetical protein
MKEKFKLIRDNLLLIVIWTFLFYLVIRVVESFGWLSLLIIPMSMIFSLILLFFILICDVYAYYVMKYKKFYGFKEEVNLLKEEVKKDD